MFELPAGISLAGGATSFPSTPNSNDLYISTKFSVENGAQGTPGFGNPMLAAAPEPAGALLVVV